MGYLVFFSNVLVSLRKKPKLFTNGIFFICFRLVDWSQLRRHGYVFRMEYEAFLARYKMLSVHTWPHWMAGGSVDGVTCLLRDLPISANEYAFGRTKIFIRTSKTVSDILNGYETNSNGTTTDDYESNACVTK